MGITQKQRYKMVDQMLILWERKEYKKEAFFRAVSVADRYLATLVKTHQKAPDLVHLATICTLISAKLEQPISPSFTRMISLLEPA